MRETGSVRCTVSPLGGVEKKFSNAIFSVTVRDIDAVVSLQRAPYGCPSSAPTSLGLGAPLWGSGPPNQKFMSGDPEIF